MNGNSKYDVNVQPSCGISTDRRQLKPRNHRPIILLRRSSCSSITRKIRDPTIQGNGGVDISREQSSNQMVKLPRLKSMSDIERRNDSNSFKPQIISNNNPLQVRNHIKLEPFDGSQAVEGMWRNSEENKVNSFLPTSSQNSFSFMQPSGSQASMVMQALQNSQIAQNVPIKMENISQPFPQPVAMDTAQIFANQSVQPRFSNNFTLGSSQLQLNNAAYLNNQYLVHCESNEQQNIPVSFQQEYLRGPNCGGFYALQNTGTNELRATHPNIEEQIASNSIRWAGGKGYDSIETAMVDDSLTNITWLGRMGVNNFLPLKMEKEKRCLLPLSGRDDKTGRPPYSYMALIQFAINSSQTRRLTLRQIYLWIEEKFPYFKHAKPGWKNSIRHNLSLHDIFVREVSATSKASFWTLRPDLNMRPLTLESVKGGAQHTFQACQSNNGSLWSYQPVANGQKPILPRLPPCSQPYILLPVPVMNHSPNKHTGGDETKTSNALSSTSFQRDCSSVFADSGFISDLSTMTPSTSRSRIFSGHITASSGGGSRKDPTSSLIFSNEKEKGPFIKSENIGKIITSRKRARKEPLKTLNDSLNNSLHFVKEEIRSRQNSPCFSSPELHRKSPKFKMRPGRIKYGDTTKENSMKVKGLCEDSFSEMMNDLGTPFKTLFSRNNLSDEDDSLIQNPPKRLKKLNVHKYPTKQPYSPRSAAVPLSHRTFNEKTPVTHNRDMDMCITPVKKERGEVQDHMPHQPTSTPVCDEKFRKKPSFNLLTPPSKTRESILESLRADMHFRTPKNRNCFKSDLLSDRSPSTSRNQSPQLTSPILRQVLGENGEISSDFMNDLMGVVFKTPDKPSLPIRHFDSLTPENGKMTIANLSEFDSKSGAGSEFLHSGNLDQINMAKQSTITESPSRGFLPSIFGNNNADSSVFNNSFSKLLDLSGISLLGTSGCSTSQLQDLADVSWSNLANI